MADTNKAPGGGGSGQNLRPESDLPEKFVEKSGYRTPSSLNVGYGGSMQHPKVIGDNTKS